MTLTTIILLVLALYVVQIFLQETSRFGFHLRGIVGNRDNQNRGQSALLRSTLALV